MSRDFELGIRPSVHKTFLRFQWNMARSYRSTSDAWRYAVWPDPRSRSRTLKSSKSFHFRKLSPPPFTMGANDHWFLNYGTLSKFRRVGFFIFVLVFVSRDFKLDTVRPSVCTCVHPQNVSSISTKIWHVGSGRWVIYEYAVWPNPRSRSRALESCKSCHFLKLPPPPFTMGAGNWPLMLKLWHNMSISTFDWAGFLIFVLVFVSRDFELGRNVSREMSTVSPIWGYFLYLYLQFYYRIWVRCHSTSCTGKIEIMGDFIPYFHCTCAEMTICDLPFNLMTTPLSSRYMRWLFYWLICSSIVLCFWLVCHRACADMAIF